MRRFNLKTRNNEERKALFSDEDKENIRWFWRRYLKAKMPWMFAVMGMILVQGLVYQQFLSMTEDGLRVIFDSGSFGDLLRICIVVFLLFSMRAVVSFLVPRISVRLASDAVLKMREDLINHLMILDLAFFERTNSGEIILRLVNQTQDLSQFVGQTTVRAVRDAVTVVFVSAYLIYKSALLFSVVILVIPVIIYVMRVVSSSIKHIQSTAENAMGNYMNGIEEMSNGMRTVKISNQEPVERNRLIKSASEIKVLSNRLQSAQARVVPTIDMLSACAYVLIIGGGGYMALSPAFDMDGAAIITFLFGIVLVFDPARLLAQFFARLQASLVLLNSVRSLYHEQPTVVNAPDAIEDFDAGGDLNLVDITFRYSDDAPLFDGLSMLFKGGKISAIVGATGSGKTTILSLLTRLYNVDGGTVTLGSQPINSLQISRLRQSFSVVSQDIVIFNSSIWENIRYVRPNATEAEIWEAAENAEIADLMRARGDAPLGPKGSQLSGGQKQRIAIARAFLRSAPILLLDEATSALDQKTEDKVKAALARLSVGKTTIIVAHRLSAVTHADRIFVLDAGSLVEQGTHENLLAQDGLYAKMYTTQKKSYD